MTRQQEVLLLLLLFSAELTSSPAAAPGWPCFPPDHIGGCNSCLVSHPVNVKFLAPSFKPGWRSTVGVIEVLPRDGRQPLLVKVVLQDPVQLSLLWHTRGIGNYDLEEEEEEEDEDDEIGGRRVEVSRNGFPPLGRTDSAAATP